MMEQLKLARIYSFLFILFISSKSIGQQKIDDLISCSCNYRINKQEFERNFLSNEIEKSVFFDKKRNIRITNVKQGKNSLYSGSEYFNRSGKLDSAISEELSDVFTNTYMYRGGKLIESCLYENGIPIEKKVVTRGLDSVIESTFTFSKKWIPIQKEIFVYQKGKLLSHNSFNFSLKKYLNNEVYEYKNIGDTFVIRKRNLLDDNLSIDSFFLNSKLILVNYNKGRLSIIYDSSFKNYKYYYENELSKEETYLLINGVFRIVKILNNKQKEVIEYFYDSIGRPIKQLTRVNDEITEIVNVNYD